MGLGIEKPLPGMEGEVKIGLNMASLQILQEHPGNLQKPLGRVGTVGIEKGLLARIEERLASFRLVDINDTLGKIFEERGHKTCQQSC